MPEKARNYTIDTLRIVLCLMVFCIHMPEEFPENIRPYLVGLARIAVPMFFMISGYFIYDETPDVVVTRIKKQLKRLIPLLIFMLILYYSWFFLHQYSLFGKIRQSDIQSVFGTQALLSFFVYNRPINSADLLWYLPAYIYVLLIYLAFIKIRTEEYRIKSSNSGLIIMTIILMTVFILVSEITTFNNYKDFFLMFRRNFLFFGLPFFTVGYVIKSYMRKTNKQKKLAWIFGILTIISLGLLFAEMHLRSMFVNAQDMAIKELYIMCIPLAIFLFLFCIYTPNIGKISKIYLIGSKYTLYIYCYHVIIKDLLLECEVYHYLFISVLLSSFFVAFLHYHIAKAISKKFPKLWISTMESLTFKKNNVIIIK